MNVRERGAPTSRPEGTDGVGQLSVARPRTPDGLGDRLLSSLAPPALRAVVGVAGTGKSGLLDFVAAGLTARGIAVARMAGGRDQAGATFGALRPLGAGLAIADPARAAAALLAELGPPPWLLAVDDAHLLDDPTLAVISETARQAAAHGGGVLSAYRPAPATAGLDELAAALTAERDPLILGTWTAARVAVLPAVGGDARRAARLVDATGGNPRLTVMLARSASPVPAAAVAAVAAELAALPDGAARHVLSLVGEPDRCVPSAGGHLAALVAAGLARSDGAVVPLVRSALARLAADAGRGVTGSARPPVRSGRDPLDAEVAWRDGDAAAAIAAADRILAAGADDECRAAGVAAAGAAADGALLDAADRWRRIAATLGSPRGGWAGGRAALVAALAGDIQAATRDLADTRTQLGTPAPRGLTVLLDGVDAALDALRGRPGRALHRLAGVAAAGVPHDPLAPVQWDELEVAIATANGEDTRAAARLAAPHGQSRTERRLLLTAWLDLRAGRLDAARAALSGAVDRPSLRRDAVLIAAVTVGLARRGRAGDGLAATWHRVAPMVAGADVEPLLLDAWGELSVVAAQVSPTDRDTIVDAMRASVVRAGFPAWCAATYHWWELEQAAALADPDGAAAAAAQLAALTVDHRSSDIAEAGRVWAATLVGNVDVPAVVRSAARLAAAGRGWAAGHLCSTAAAQVADPAAARALLSTGRRLAIADAASPQDVSGGLTNREREVGALLLDGLTQKEIGSRLFLSPKTVEQHVARIRQKLVVSNRAQLIAALRSRLAVPTRYASVGPGSRCG